MGMFTKVIAFLDKAAGVPAWVTHADNIRKLEERGCPSLAKAIATIPEMGHVASWEPVEVWGIMVQPDNWIEKVLPEKTFDTIKTEIEQREEEAVWVALDTADALAKSAEEVLASSEDEDLEAFVARSSPVQEEALAALRTDQELSELSMEMVVTPLVASVEDLAETGELSNAALDPQVRKQLMQGMMKVISRGRKPGPTLKVLKTMAGEDQAAITEALEEMAQQGNRLASAILEDPSL